MFYLKKQLTIYLLLTLIFTVQTGKLYAQAMYAEYHVAMHRVVPLSEDSPFYGLIDIPVEIELKYMVSADANYLYVKGKTLSVSTPDSVTAHGSDSTIIIDRKSGIIYFPDEKQYKRIVEYELIGNSRKDSCFVGKVSGFDDTFLVTTCPGIPVIISPGILFGNLKNGIQKVEAPNYNITLSKFNTIPDILDFSSYFQHIDPDTIKAEYRFFE